jgi:hypothetical protein
VKPLDDPTKMLLFEPNRLIPYACFSYCLGMDLDGVLKTTKDNLPTQFEVIEFESLLNTIADAVMVYGNLQIPNLWVDSL